MTMIPAAQVSHKRQIGKLGSDPVWEIATIGGLHLVVAMRKGKAETLGIGPHRAVARFLAEKREPTLVIHELAKSDYVDPKYFAHLVDDYGQLTLRLRKADGFVD